MTPDSSTSRPSISWSVPARIGILGNPSDGYGGRTLGFAVENFAASVTLEPVEGSAISILPAIADQPTWASASTLADSVDRYGYATAVPLLAATVRTFVDVARASGGSLSELGGFSLSYGTTIPRQVGLAGSSALVVATLRCLCEFSEIEVPDAVLASIALAVETEQLQINAGLQDRVIQVYGGLVSMDFGEMTTNARFGVAHGSYERVDPSLLPPMFLAYREGAAESSGTYHRDLRARFDAGDGVVREAMRSLAALVPEGRAALQWRAFDTFGSLVAKNMELRRQLGPLPQMQLELVEVAAEFDAPATFTGSGGAVVGVYENAEHLEALRRSFANVEAVVVDLASDAEPSGA